MWILSTERASGPRQRGGLNAEIGLDFQKDWACLQLVSMLFSDCHIERIRYDCWQDVDIRNNDGTELCVQLKKESNKKYSLDSLKETLQNFALDFIESEENEKLQFKFIAHSSNMNEEVERLSRGTSKPTDLKKIAKFFGESNLFSELSNDQCFELVKRLLCQITFSFGEGSNSFEASACVKLAESGIDGKDLRNAYKVLKGALQPRQEYTKSDVQELLKSYAGKTAIEIFDGGVEILAANLFTHSAKEKRISEFYKGAPLGWDIINAQADVRRDAESDLLEQLIIEPDRLQLFCVIAEPGAGKSTFARRLACELYHQQNAMVIRVIKEEKEEIWYRLQDFYNRVSRPFYVLVDDLFRGRGWQALEELDCSLPIKILATSNANEYQKLRLQETAIQVKLEKPSGHEKSEILKQFGKSLKELTPAQKHRFNDANHFLVLMMEMSEGENHKIQIARMLERLKVDSAHTHRAYGYVCFAYRHSVGFPKSLLEKLENVGENFDDIKKQKAAQGLIFEEEGKPENLCAGHATLANITFDLFDPPFSAEGFLKEIFSKIDEANLLERRFAALLLQSLAKADRKLIDSTFPKIQQNVVRCVDNSSSIDELSTWRDFFKTIKHEKTAQICAQAALKLEPQSEIDCNKLLNLYRDFGRQKDALRVFEKWIQAHEESASGRTPYLSLLKDFGTPDEIYHALEQTKIWLEAHSRNSSVRPIFLSLVERKGTQQQINEAIAETHKWLESHSYGSLVQGAYLSLVQKRGTAEQLESALIKTSEWLKLYQEDANVWAKYLEIAEKRANSKRAEQVINEACLWLEEHPNNSSVREGYLQLLETRGTDDQIIKALQETSEWLKSCLDDQNVRTKYLGLVREKGTNSNVESSLKDVTEWLNQNIENINVRTAYLNLVERRGDLDAVNIAIDEMVDWLNDHQEDTQVRSAYLGLIEQRIPEKKNATIREFQRWLQDHPNAIRVWSALIALLRRSNDFTSALNAARQAVSVNPGNSSLLQQLKHLEKQFSP